NANCMTCNVNTDCGPSNYSCLQFIVEGQTALFCGSTCSTDADCPSGFECGGVIYGCDPAQGCPATPDGTPVQCLLFNPVNESPSYFCAGPNGQPYTYFSACSPLSGVCPALPYP